MASNDFDPDLNHLGRELRGLTPRPCPIDRDAVMFRAGQSSVPRNWLWPVLTALATCAAVTFGAALLVQPGPEVMYPPGKPYGQQATPTWPSGPPGLPDDLPPGMAGNQPAAAEEESWPTPDTNYFHTQNNVLRWGLAGVPLPPTASPPRTERRDMLMRSF
jgi:hypothetical protein